MSGIVLAVVRKLNGVNADNVKPYLHQRYLKPKFSVDGRWASLSALFKNVLADYVALDSPAPLKARGSRGLAEGDIPKAGNKYALTEKQFEDIENMILRGMSDKEIIDELFADAKNSVTNIFELNEYSFLKGLCDGVLEADQDVSNGVAIRANFRYLAANQFKAKAAKAISVEDIDKVVKKAKADGNVIKTLFLDAISLDRISKSQTFKEEFAFNAGFVGQTIPNLTSSKIAEFFQSKWKITLETNVDRTFIVQKNGVDKSVRPWADGVMIFTSSDNLGGLVYSKLVEHTRKSKKADYVEANEYILVSKFSKIDPLVEYTKAEAKVLPVIGGVEGIYRLDSNEAALPEG